MSSLLSEDQVELCVKDEPIDTPSEATMSPTDCDRDIPLDQGEVESACGFGGCGLPWNHPGLCEVPILSNGRSRQQPKRLSSRLQGVLHTGESELELQNETPEESASDGCVPESEAAEDVPQSTQERRTSPRACEPATEQDPARSADGDATPKRGAEKRKREDLPVQTKGPGGLVTEVDGLQLHLSKQSTTGYKGVVDCSKPGQERNGRPFKAQATAGQVRPLGYFATKLEAAICYAKWALEEKGSGPSAPSAPRPKKKKSSERSGAKVERRAPTLSPPFGGMADQFPPAGARAGGSTEKGDDTDLNKMPTTTRTTRR